MSPEYGHVRLRTDTGYMEVVGTISLKVRSSPRPRTAAPHTRRISGFSEWVPAHVLSFIQCFRIP